MIELRWNGRVLEQRKCFPQGDASGAISGYSDWTAWHPVPLLDEPPLPAHYSGASVNGFFKSKAFLKTVSWLFVSGLLIAVAGYCETGNFRASIMAAVWACVFKTPVYWLHEFFWERAGVPDPDIDL